MRGAVDEQGLVDAVAREKEQNARLRAVDLEAWYTHLQPFTFRTVFVALHPSEARALVAAFWARKDVEDGVPRKRVVTDEQQTQLRALEERVGAGMEELASGAGAMR